MASRQRLQTCDEVLDAEEYEGEDVRDRLGKSGYGVSTSLEAFKLKLQRCFVLGFLGVSRISPLFGKIVMSFSGREGTISFKGKVLSI